jgi:antitoxin CcdA
MRAAAGTPPKRTINVSIRRDLLEAGLASKIDLSATLEQALIGKLREAQDWVLRDENREALAAYNRHIEKQGVFSDGSRIF